MDSAYLQRRYLISFSSQRLGHIFTDVLIVGCGSAGLRAAISSADFGQVIVTSKDKIPESNTLYAQGGLAAVIDSADSIDSHVADTLCAGGGMGDKDIVRRVLADVPAQIEQLQKWGMNFDECDGKLDLGMEGGHRAHRIVHAQGDASGRELMRVLCDKARQSDNIKFFEECFVIDLLTDPPAGGSGSTCIGALTFHPRFGLQIIRAKCTILAAGGAGMLWRESTNPPCATADAISLAFRAGANLADMEMMQFHPTTLYVAGSTRSLVSEAVRGEGAKLLDKNENRFMPEYHEMAELAPRDIVSRAIMSQMAKTDSTHVFLDVRDMKSAFARRFPHINEKCREFGIEPSQDLIPVHPAAHYMIGGASVDIDGNTSINNLLACGEAACSGLHGANRLASNSLTESLVFGKQCGISAGKIIDSTTDKLAPSQIDWENPKSARTELDLTDIRNSLRSIMWRNVAIARNGERLGETLEIISFWGRYVLDKEFFSPFAWESQNLLTAAYAITQSALTRTETRGVHYRTDFPNENPAWVRHQIIRRTPHQLVVE